MASDDVVVVAEFLVGVSNEVIEIQEVQELAKETIIMEHVEEEEQVEVEQVVEEEEEVLMKSLECISLQDHDYTFATEAIEVNTMKIKNNNLTVTQPLKFIYSIDKSNVNSMHIKICNLHLQTHQYVLKLFIYCHIFHELANVIVKNECRAKNKNVVNPSYSILIL